MYSGSLLIRISLRENYLGLNDFKSIYTYFVYLTPHRDRMAKEHAIKAKLNPFLMLQASLQLPRLASEKHM